MEFASKDQTQNNDLRSFLHRENFSTINKP